ncbi:hypothetical protein MJO28_012288 [Puccinia striiformis f. sp. tritici]|uniref:Uncharacterized protein n=1 Tax=Puccinia striiformis f. sp. tritici TaxID=168172 RepID=A0ACC0E025_9BASI|nr:hypothetical protein MJO28_012288 [Puccinia striiformis f. sp. tritici]
MPTLGTARRTTIQPSSPSPSSPTTTNEQPNTIQSMDTQFEPLDIIGTGSFGIIRKVKRTTDGLILARKELNYGRMDERDLRQLGEEVNILQNLRGNEHIVKYFERYVDKQNFMLYILMEYCSQGDLAGVISRCRRDQVHLSEDTVWSYLAQITTALADCHSSEISSDETGGSNSGTGKKKPIILHRDIKPENVFLNHFGLVKLGDFGLSKAMEMAAFTNTYVGTPYYMSPELINGQQYDVKSDIWALGCLIYELCAWHPPFHQAQTQPELAKLIREGKIPNLPRGYSSQLTALIKSMLRQDPKLRPDAKTILMVEQVKHQTRVLEVHRYARELTKKQSELEEREKGIEERENKLKSRESKLQREKDYFKTQQENHLVLQQEFQAKFQNAMEVIEHANRIERVLQDENLGIDLHDGDRLTMDESDSEIITDSKSSSNNSNHNNNNRRIPLSERRLSLNPPGFTSGSAPSPTPTLNYVHTKRLSMQQKAVDLTMVDASNLTVVGYGSPMKLDTPFKHLAGPTTSEPSVIGLAVTGAPPPSQNGGSDPRPSIRQVKSSKSLASLKSTYSLLTRLKSNEDIQSNVEDGGSGTATSATTRKMAGTLEKQKTTSTMTSKSNEPRSRRLSRRSESANGLLLGPSINQIPSQQNVNSRRPTSTIGSISTPGGSTNSTNSAEPLLSQNDDKHLHPSSSHHHQPSAQATPTSSTRSPRYNYADPDSLPSPFLKKKSSASTLVSNFLRPTSTLSNPSSTTLTSTTSTTNTAPGSPRKTTGGGGGPARTSSIDTSGISNGMKRIPSMLQHIRTNHLNHPPPLATRPSQISSLTTNKRPSSTNTTTGSNNPSGKPSLTSRFLSHRDDSSSHSKKSNLQPSSASSATGSNHLVSKRKDSLIF